MAMLYGFKKDRISQNTMKKIKNSPHSKTERFDGVYQVFDANGDGV